MPPLLRKSQISYPNDYKLLFVMGVDLANKFCEVNDLDKPKAITPVPWTEWIWPVCAYYRPKEGIKIQLQRCAKLAQAPVSRNWNWPGATTDREPIGVIAHELAHHCDWSVSSQKGSYSGNYSEALMRRSGEPSISSYEGTRREEWFAEIFRLFITNAYLLKELRPKTFELLLGRWKPISDPDWRKQLGANVPARILSNLEKKI